MQHVAPLFSYLSLNCLFQVLSPLVGLNRCKLLLTVSLFLLFLCVVLYLCVLWSVLFLLMYVACPAVCVQDPLPPVGNPTAVNKYRIVSYHSITRLTFQPNSVTEIDWWLVQRNTEKHNHNNPSDRTMALGSTQPLNRNEYQEHFLGIKAAGV